MTALLFNAEALALFVGTRIERRSASTLAAAAAEAGITKAQIWRVIHKQPVNIAAFLNLCLWMEANPYAFLLDPETGRGLAPLPEAAVPRETPTETRGKPRKSRGAR